MSLPASRLASSIRASRSRTPITLVVKPSSTGGSNDTSPAQCTTASRSVGSAGTSARSPSTTATRAAISASTPPGRLDDVGEDRLLEQLGGPVGTAGRPLGPDQDAHPQVRDVGQDQVQQRLADEAGDAGEQDVLPRQPLRDRPLRHARDRAMCVPLLGSGVSRSSRCLVASRLDRPDSRSPSRVDLRPHPLRIGPRVVAQRPPDRLAQPERAVVEVGLDDAHAAGRGRSPRRGRPGR